MSILRTLTLPLRAAGTVADFGGHNPVTAELQDWLIPHHDFMFPIPGGMSPNDVTGLLEGLGVRVWGKMLMGNDTMVFSVYQGHAMRAWRLMKAMGIETLEDAQSVQRKGIHGTIMGAIWGLFGLHRLMGGASGQARGDGRGGVVAGIGGALGLGALFGKRSAGTKRRPAVVAVATAPFRAVRWAFRAIGL